MERSDGRRAPRRARRRYATRDPLTSAGDLRPASSPFVAARRRASDPPSPIRAPPADPSACWARGPSAASRSAKKCRRLRVFHSPLIRLDNISKFHTLSHPPYPGGRRLHRRHTCGRALHCTGGDAPRRGRADSGTLFLASTAYTYSAFSAFLRYAYHTMEYTRTFDGKATRAVGYR